MSASDRKSESPVINYEGEKFTVTICYLEKAYAWNSVLNVHQPVEALIREIAHDPIIRDFIAAEIEAYILKSGRPTFFYMDEKLKQAYLEIFNSAETETKETASETTSSRAAQIKEFCKRMDVCTAFLKHDASHKDYKLTFTSQGGLIDAIARLYNLQFIVYSESEAQQYLLIHDTKSHHKDLYITQYRILVKQKNESYYYRLILDKSEHVRFYRALDARNKKVLLANGPVDTDNFIDIIEQSLALLAHQNEAAFQLAYKSLNPSDQDNFIFSWSDSSIKYKIQKCIWETKNAILKQAREDKEEKENIAQYDFSLCADFYKINPHLHIFFSHLAYCLEPRNIEKRKKLAESFLMTATSHTESRKEKYIESYQARLGETQISSLALQCAATDARNNQDYFIDFQRMFLLVLRLTRSDPALLALHAKALSYYHRAIFYHNQGDPLGVSGRASIAKLILLYGENQVRQSESKTQTVAKTQREDKRASSAAAESKIPTVVAAQLPLSIYDIVTKFHPDANNFYSFALTSKVHLASFTKKFSNPEMLPDIEAAVDNKLSLFDDIYPKLNEKFNKDVIKKRLMLLIHMQLITVDDINNHLLIPLIFLAIHINKDYPIIARQSGIRTKHQEVLANIEDQYCLALAKKSIFKSFVSDKFSNSQISANDLKNAAYEIIKMQAEMNFANAFGENFKFLRYACGRPAFYFAELAKFKFSKEERDLIHKLLPCNWFDFAVFFINFIVPNKKEKDRPKIHYVLTRLVNSRQQAHLEMGSIEFTIVLEKILGELASLEEHESSISAATDKFGKEQIAQCASADLTANFGICQLPEFASQDAKDFKEFVAVNKKQFLSIKNAEIVTQKDFAVVRATIKQFSYDAKDESTEEFKEFHRIVAKILEWCLDKDFQYYCEMVNELKFYQPFYVKKYLSQLSRTLDLKNVKADLESKEPTINKRLAIKILLHELEMIPSTHKLDDKEYIYQCCILLKEKELRTSGISKQLHRIDQLLYARVMKNIPPEDMDEESVDDDLSSDTKSHDVGQSVVSAPTQSAVGAGANVPEDLWGDTPAPAGDDSADWGEFETEEAADTPSLGGW